MFAGYIVLCMGYIRFDTFHIAGYIALCTGYIKFDTFHIVGYIALCTGYITFNTFHIAGYIELCTGYIALRDKDDHYLANCSDHEFKQLDFVVAFPKKKDWFYVMSQPNKCWTNENLKQQSHSKYRYTTTNCFFKTYIDNTSTVSEYENKIVGTIKGFGILGGLPWHLTDKVYVPVNCNGVFHWVLAVVVLKERCIKTKPTGQFLNLTKERTNLTHSKSAMLLILPNKQAIVCKYCGLFIAAYAEFLSEGLQVPSYGISSKTLRMRYASLLWNYGTLKAQSDYVSNNEDPQRPRPKKAKFDENVVVTTID
ncbi:hypothetical protein H5410_000851 [Solanum commersonii]|uniref:Ubiquitin-like protease family profile domain-containing protein n=1 Tax=Solanum commersonii TaxID=4109 RepID=A0A9J6AX85_SOLCO|nr:hypothetical protein H5410_000851 [Solanum commersonii]